MDETEVIELLDSCSDAGSEPAQQPQQQQQQTYISHHQQQQQVFVKQEQPLPQQPLPVPQAPVGAAAAAAAAVHNPPSKRRRTGNSCHAELEAAGAMLPSTEGVAAAAAAAAGAMGAATFLQEGTGGSGGPFMMAAPVGIGHNGLNATAVFLAAAQIAAAAAGGSGAVGGVQVAAAAAGRAAVNGAADALPTDSTAVRPGVGSPGGGGKRIRLRLAVGGAAAPQATLAAAAAAAAGLAQAAPSPPQQQRQSLTTHTQHLQHSAAAAAAAAGGGGGAAHVQKTAIQLDQQYKVWPDLDNSSSSSRRSTVFDLVPTSCVSPQANKLMQELMQVTQPPHTKAPAAPGKGRRGRPPANKSGAASAAGGGKGNHHQQQAGGKKGRKGASDAGIAAAAAAGAAADLWYDESWGVDDWGCPGDASSQHHDDPHLGSSAVSAATGGGCGGAAAAAAAAACDYDDSDNSEEAWYAEAEQQHLHFTWRDAPRGRFYMVKPDTQLAGAAVWLEPSLLVTRQSLSDQQWEMERRSRVQIVTDPCHPCKRNAVRPAVLPPGEHHMLVARKDLKPNQLLGLYWGKVVTQEEDQASSAADLSCAYGQRHAYNMDVVWSKGKLYDSLLVMGDSDSCRVCLINDSRSWAEDMQAKGWGPCPQAASGTCHCEEFKQHVVNVTWKHFVYRALNGDYVAAIAALTSRAVVQGSELLASYEEQDAGFWNAVRTNLAQHCYVNTLQQQSKVQTAALQRILQWAQAQPPSPSLQQVEQLAATGLREAQEQGDKLDILKAEAEAVARGEQIPEAVAEARRLTSGRPG